MPATKSKIFVRHKSSGRLLAEEGNWVETIKDAKLFASICEAFVFCCEKKLRGVQVVIRMGLPEYDVIVDSYLQ